MTLNPTPSELMRGVQDKLEFKTVSVGIELRSDRTIIDTPVRRCRMDTLVPEGLH